jgi:hypothetical protein
MHKIRLFLELQSEPRQTPGEDECDHADGWVIGPRCAARLRADPDRYRNGCRVMMDVEPRNESEQEPRSDTVWAVKGDPDIVARCRDRWPDLNWVPRADVLRPVARFDFQPEFHGEGFKTYAPDLNTYRRFHVTGAELELGEWLRRTSELEFPCVWLHGVDAAARGRGLDLEMLERARRSWDGELWISGGVTSQAHLVNLVESDAPEAVIVPEKLVHNCGLQSLRRALAPRLAVEVQQSSTEDACASQARGSERCPDARARI